MDKQSPEGVAEEGRLYWRSGQPPGRLAMGVACRGGVFTGRAGKEAVSPALFNLICVDWRLNFPSRIGIPISGPFWKIVPWHGFGDAKALQYVALMGDEEVFLGVRFHTFGHHFEAQAVG